MENSQLNLHFRSPLLEYPAFSSLVFFHLVAVEEKNEQIFRLTASSFEPNGGRKVE